MSEESYGGTKPKKGKMDQERLDKVVSSARNSEHGDYRSQSLRIHPWICARCGREFVRENLHLLHVHHVDHDHHNNPPDGSNWEHLCIYCHDNEHSRLEDASAGSLGGDSSAAPKSSHNPFAQLDEMLKKR